MKDDCGAIIFESIGDSWGKVTHVGIFVRRPWWQRILGLIYRPWRWSRCIDHSVMIDGKLRERVPVEGGEMIICNISFGYEDPDA